jgi:hypothetical protein
MRSNNIFGFEDDTHIQKIVNIIMLVLLLTVFGISLLCIMLALIHITQIGVHLQLLQLYAIAGTIANIFAFLDIRNDPPRECIFALLLNFTFIIFPIFIYYA